MYICYDRMTKKQIIRTEDITENDILSLYESVLPLLYYNPKKISPAKRIKEWLNGFIPFDFGFYTTVTRIYLMTSDF